MSLFWLLNFFECVSQWKGEFCKWLKTKARLFFLVSRFKLESCRVFFKSIRQSRFLCLYVIRVLTFEISKYEIFLTIWLIFYKTCLNVTSILYSFEHYISTSSLVSFYTTEPRCVIFFFRLLTTSLEGTVLWSFSRPLGLMSFIFFLVFFLFSFWVILFSILLL